jgi:cysteine desulfurase / selenocysteine lyase
MSGAPDWMALRDDMPVARRWAYFDHAAVAPISATTRAAIDAWSRDASRDGVAAWGTWRKSVENTRRLAAELIGAKSREIALVRNTTEGLSIVAEGFPWEPGDNVVTFSSEFPSNLHPWQNLATRGVEPRIVETVDERIDLDRLAATIDDRTRIVSVSWVGYATGYRVDLDALADLVHDRGALLCVDGIQGLGVLPLDVSMTPIDFLAADGHKWLLGPEGAGLLYVREAHLDTLRPLGVGWNSVASPGDFGDTVMRLKASAARYEGGTYAMPCLVGLEAALRTIVARGVGSTAARLRAVTDDLCARLAELDAEIASDRTTRHWSGIVACTLPNRDPHELKRRCLERRVLVNVRGGRLRLSPHVHTNADDCDRLLDVLAG